MKSTHQLNIENYHSGIEKMRPRHNMHVMHLNWHQDNPDPSLPSSQDPNWGVNLIFGTNFLQMHHEMVKATNSESHYHMEHASVADWYKTENISLPSEWNPLSAIPNELLFEPDASVYPDEIRIPIEQYAESQGQTIKEFLTRKTDTPSFEFPKYFTVDGVTSSNDADPLTGATKLSDFVNTNQLGCSLVFPHNEWHGAIGGAMSVIWTAIADPIFYLGVHWHMDKIFDDFKMIEAERKIRALDAETLSNKSLLSGVESRKSKKFTGAQQAKLQNFQNVSQAIKGPTGI